MPVNDALIDGLIEHGIGLDSRHTLLKERYVDRMHDEGLLVNVWTVNSKKDYCHVVDDLGVDMITMNDVKNSFDKK